MKNIFLIIATLCVAILPFLPEPSTEAAGTWSIFLGRFHILLLHLPVVLVLLLVVLEIGKRLWPKIDTGNLLPFAWIVALASCFLTVAAGYLLYLSGEYQGDTVRNHLWGGVLLTITLAVAAFLRTDPRRSAQQAYPMLVGLAGGLVLYTSHLGGSLTHGPDFLSEYAPTLGTEQPSAAEQKPREELLVFTDLIMPALEDRCLSCHNTHKTKGDLLMTSYAGLAKGGKSKKPMLVAGQPEQSELFVRITLPAEDDDHMPPPEKPALSEDEITLIKWWIAEGADLDMKLQDGPPGAEGAALIERYLPTLFRSQRLKIRQQEELAELQKELEKLAEKLELVIKPDEETPGFFAVSLSIPPAIVDDKVISRLLPYAEVFSKISLPGAEITDDGLYDLGKMPNLQKLYLPKTCIKGQGLVYLQSLKNLRELNLSYTFLNDEGALNLLHLQQLEKVYVYGTDTGANVLEALRKNMPDVELLEAEGEYY